MKSVYKFALLAIGGLSLFSANAQSSMFSPEQVEEDLSFAYATLQESHYNPHMYNTQERIDSAYLYAVASVGKDSLTAVEANSVIQRFVSNLNNGHTTLAFPVAEYIAYAQNGGTLFPFELIFRDNHGLDNGVYVGKSYVNSTGITEFTNVISIDGRSMEDVLKELGYYMPAEDQYFKLAKIEALSFPRLYWQVYGQQDTFEIVFENSRHGQFTRKIAAVPVVEGYEMQRDEVLNAAMSLRFEENIAILNPGSFGGDQSVYESFIDSAFRAIREVDAAVLVIDLRNNAGGDDAFSNYMVAYIADRPFRWCSDFRMRSSEALKAHTRANYDTTLPFFARILEAENGEVYSYDFGTIEPQADSLRFDGKVAVLVNRQTHSQAVVTAAQISDYGWGRVWGEQTGEYPSVVASLFPVTLPETGFTLQVAKGYIVRINGGTGRIGLMPDIEYENLDLMREEVLWDEISREAGR